MTKDTGLTTYSEKIKGDSTNYDRPARFDLTNGCLGITDFEDRVLLTPDQIKELVKFIKTARSRS